MASSRVRMRKQALENITMHVHRIREIQMVNALEIEVIFLLEKLIHNKTYDTVIGPEKWDLQVVRRRRDVTLTLSTQSFLPETPLCYVRYDDTGCSDRIEPTEATSFDTYIFTLPTNVISNPKNVFWTSGKGLVCVLEVSVSIDRQVSPHAGTSTIQKTRQLPPLPFAYPRPPNRLTREESDEDRLLDTLISKSAKRLFPDFELLTVDGKVIKAHRSILATRSRFFRDLLRKSEKLVKTIVKFKEIKLQLAVSFMYFSEICYPKPELALSLQDLSKKLEIESLYRVCKEYINFKSIKFNFPRK